MRSLMSRGIEAQILPTVRELGIGITAYGVLSRGLISDSLRTGQLAADDYRSHSPRFQGESLDRNRVLVDQLAAIAATRHHRRPASDRLVADPRRRHRAADRHQQPGAPDPSCGGHPGRAHRRGPRRDRGGDAGRRRGRRALRARPNGHLDSEH